MKLLLRDAAVTINNIDADFSNLNDITAYVKPENVIVESKTVIFRAPSAVRQFYIFVIL